MKFALTFLLSAFAAVSASMEIRVGETLKTSSKLGKELMSKARRLDEAEDMANYQWVADYSIKFQGCHHLVQWNDAADEQQDVRLYRKRLVRFRLCPSTSCSSESAAGCAEGYGDYVIDMQTFLESYYQSKMEAAQEECGQYAENYCSCEGNGDDAFDQGKCMYQCIVDAGMTQCYQYMEDQMNEQFQPQEFMECAQFKWEGNNRRKLDQELQYYVGPFCSEQGGAIHLGMFTDDTCSTVVEDDSYGALTFESMTGFAMPYTTKSIIGSECTSCTQVDENQDNNNNNGEQQEVQITEVCEAAYLDAGKCETMLGESVTKYPNTNACTYIAGIKVVREDGMVFYQKSHANAVTTAFIVIFAMAFFAMGFYVWYLRTRLNVKPDALL